MRFLFTAWVSFVVSINTVLGVYWYSEGSKYVSILLFSSALANLLVYIDFIGLIKEGK